MPHSQEPRLRGVLAPVLTPFDAQLKPDAERFARLCHWLVAQQEALQQALRGEAFAIDGLA